MALIDDLQTVESKSVDEIYEMIGEQLLSKTLGADDFSEDEIREEAVTWYGQIEDKLRAIVCKSRIYNLYVKNPERWDWMMTVASIADLISPTITGVAPVAVAALLVKKGLDNLCAENNS